MPASDAMEGGDEGNSCAGEAGNTGSDRGTSGRSWQASIVGYRQTKDIQRHSTQRKTTDEKEG